MSKTILRATFRFIALKYPFKPKHQSASIETRLFVVFRISYIVATWNVQKKRERKRKNELELCKCGIFHVFCTKKKPYSKEQKTHVALREIFKSMECNARSENMREFLHRIINIRISKTFDYYRMEQNGMEWNALSSDYAMNSQIGIVTRFSSLSAKV